MKMYFIIKNQESLEWKIALLIIMPEVENLGNMVNSLVICFSHLSLSHILTCSQHCHCSEIWNIL